MKIAFIGLKGLPYSVGGVETHVHELGSRLVERGYTAHAYVRKQYTPDGVDDDNGIALLRRPTIPTKHLDASVHSFFSAVDTIFKHYDIVHFHCIGPAAFSPISRLSRARIVTTFHRFDYESGKWGPLAKRCLRTAERIALASSHGAMAVAPFIRNHYAELGYDVRYVPNGVTLPQQDLGCELLEPLGLEPNSYYLFLGRLVPEKQPDWSIRAFLNASIKDDRKLVITGGSSATDSYVESLNQAAGEGGSRILMTGPIYGDQKEQLMANCRAFLLPSRLEGLPITLLEAMSHARPCLVGDIPPHLDVLKEGENGLLHSYRDPADLERRMSHVDSLEDHVLASIGKHARDTVKNNYDWGDVVDQVEDVYRQALAG